VGYLAEPAIMTSISHDSGHIIGDGRILHDHLQSKKFFGKLFFAVAPFLNNSLILADPTLSGNKLNLEVCSQT
jgi:hypothetical protein